MGWTLQQLTNNGIVSAPYLIPVAGNPATNDLFVSVYNNQQHFAYPDLNTNIQDAWYDGAQWHLQSINNGFSVGVLNEYAATYGPPAGGDIFVSVYNNQQHFAYLDLNTNIQDAWYDGAQWNLQQINNPNGPAVLHEYVATNGPGAAGSLFVSVYNDQQHFAYIDFRGNIQDAWYDGARWNLQQINNNGVTKGPMQNGPLSVSAYNNQHHFTYIDDFGNIQDAWWDGAKHHWNLQQINGHSAGEYIIPTPGPSPAVGGPFVSVYNGQHHFAYIDASGTIWDAFYDGAQWNLLPINNKQINNNAATDGTPVNTTYEDGNLFVSVYDRQQHFTYIDMNHNVLDAFQD
jgi:hypothetical protein